MILDENVGWSSPLVVNDSGSCVNVVCCAEAERVMVFVDVGAGNGGTSFAAGGCERVLLSQDSDWTVGR